MKHLPFWIVSWAASAVLLAPLFGWERPEHALEAVNIYAWFIGTVAVPGALSLLNQKARENGVKVWRQRSFLGRGVGVVTSLTFISGTAYVGWLGLFGTILVCWLIQLAVVSGD